MGETINKHKKMILLISISAAVLFLAGVVIWFLTRNSKIVPPEKLLEQYISDINSQNYDKMYHYLTDDVKSMITSQEFVQMNKDFYDVVKIGDCSITVKEGEDTNSVKKQARTVDYQITMETKAGELKFDNSALFSKNEQKEYLLNWSLQDIHPEMKERQKVITENSMPKRGRILDRNGIELACEGIASSVGIVPGKLPVNKEEAIAQLARLLDISSDQINKALSAKWVKEDSFVPIRTVSKDATELKTKLLTVAGIKIADTNVRLYPLGQAVGHLVGYMQIITEEELVQMKSEGYTQSSQIGKDGVEKIYEKQLRGREGFKIALVNEENEVEQILLEQPVQDGRDVTLTIDANLQTQIYSQLAGEEGYGVAIHPNTGEVLAMVSTPSYDPNDFVMGFTSKGWETINKDPAQPLYNRYKAAWVPGSTFKPLIAAMGLSNGTLDPNKDESNDGLEWQKDGSWGDYFVTTLEDYSPKTLENALIYSDNIYFAKTALNIGMDGFRKGLDSMGFHNTLPFEFEFSQSSYGKDQKIENETELADSGYGQGKILVNPLHMAVMYSAFANDGSMIKPYLLKDGAGKANFWKKNVFTKEAAEMVLQDLIQVVENPNGTGHEALIDGRVIAGKTGTAEIKDSKEDENGTELGYFVAMSADQTENPILITMMIEDVKDKGGSHFVIPKVKTCLENDS